jgi:hypothetical protein
VGDRDRDRGVKDCQAAHEGIVKPTRPARQRRLGNRLQNDSVRPPAPTPARAPASVCMRAAVSVPPHGRRREVSHRHRTHTKVPYPGGIYDEPWRCEACGSASDLRDGHRHWSNSSTAAAVSAFVAIERPAGPAIISMPLLGFWLRVKKLLFTAMPEPARGRCY